MHVYEAVICAGVCRHRPNVSPANIGRFRARTSSNHTTNRSILVYMLRTFRFAACLPALGCWLLVARRCKEKWCFVRVSPHLVLVVVPRTTSRKSSVHVSTVVRSHDVPTCPARSTKVHVREYARTRRGGCHVVCMSCHVCMCRLA